VVGTELGGRPEVLQRCGKVFPQDLDPGGPRGDLRLFGGIDDEIDPRAGAERRDVPVLTDELPGDPRPVLMHTNQSPRLPSGVRFRSGKDEGKCRKKKQSGSERRRAHKEAPFRSRDEEFCSLRKRGGEPRWGTRTDPGIIHDPAGRRQGDPAAIGSGGVPAVPWFEKLRRIFASGGRRRVEEEEDREEKAIRAPYVVTDDLDLHGFFPEQVPEIVGEFLENARRLRIDEVRIAHGKGKSVMRREVWTFLERHPLVLRFRTAPPDRGGWGATIVWLVPGDGEAETGAPDRP